jgi:hypothetical protein
LIKRVSRGIKPEDSHYSANYLAQRFRMQRTRDTHRQLATCGEKLTRAGVARQVQRSPLEACVLQCHSVGISVGFTGYLAEDPVAVTGIGKNNGGAELRLRQIGERKAD